MTEEQLAEAKSLLADVTRMQTHARQSIVSANWSMFMLWGGIGILSIAPLLAGADDIGIYWLIAAPIGAAISFWLGAKNSSDLGLGESPLPYAITAAGIFVLTFAGSWLLESRWAIAWVFIVVALGFGVFAWLDQQYAAVVFAGVLAAVFLVLGLTLEDSLTLYLSCAMLFGGSYVGLGVGLLMARP